MTATGVDYERAARVLEEAGGHVKTAIVMILVGVTAEEARRRIEVAGGFIRDAIGRS
jgi:N-acetylmuramic acid 6-phosphate etherase